MLSTLALALALLSPQAPATAAQATAKADALKEDPAVTALALKIYSQIRAGKVDEELITAEMNKALSPAVLGQYKPMFEQLGDPQKLTLETGEKTAAGTSWSYLAVFAMAQLHVHIFITPEGKVGGYRLAP